MQEVVLWEGSCTGFSAVGGGQEGSCAGGRAVGGGKKV